MLEEKTIQMVNELIQSAAGHHIGCYNSKQYVDADDIRALASLVESINAPAEQPTERSPVIGFTVSSVEEHEGDDGE
ncbi:hypothetical protein D3C74_182810 [compost metagenome]